MADFSRDAAEVGSTFSEDSGTLAIRRSEAQSRHESNTRMAFNAKASSSVFREEAALAEGRRQRQNFLTMNAYDRHKMLINEYFLYYEGATQRFVQIPIWSDNPDFFFQFFWLCPILHTYCPYCDLILSDLYFHLFFSDFPILSIFLILFHSIYIFTYWLFSYLSILR